MFKKLIILILINIYNFQIIELSNRNFNDNIKNHEYIFVEFYSESCGYCQKYKSFYEETEERMRKKDLKFGRIDLENNSKIKKLYKVEAFPTLALFIQGKPSLYLDDLYNFDDIEKFYLKRTKKSTEVISSMKEFNKALNSTRILFVYFGDSIAFIRLFDQASKHYGYDKFVLINDEDLRRKLGAREDYVGVYKNRFEKHTFTDISNINDFDELHKFFRGYSALYIEPYNDYFHRRIFHEKKNALLYFDDNSLSHYDLIYSVGDDKKDKNGLIVSIKVDSEKGKLLSKEMGINTEKLPQFVLIKHSDNNIIKYKFQGKPDRKKLGEWIEDFDNNRLKPDFRSQDIINNEGKKIIEVVGKNFDEIIMNNNKEFLLFSYTTWCNKCEVFKQYFYYLKEKYPRINIAFFNGELNDSEYVSIQEFPSIYYFRAYDKKDPIKFSQELTDQNLKEFIHKHFISKFNDL